MGGRTIIGTLTSPSHKGKTFYWIKWNKAKCDTVKVPASALEDIGNPKLGASLKCVVTALGPGMSKVKSAWCAHPMCKEVEEVDPSAVYELLSKLRMARTQKADSRFFRNGSPQTVARTARWSNSKSAN